MFPLHPIWLIIGPSIRWDLKSLIHLISRLVGTLQAVSRPIMSKPGLTSIDIDLPSVTYIEEDTHISKVKYPYTYVFGIFILPYITSILALISCKGV